MPETQFHLAGLGAEGNIDIDLSSFGDLASLKDVLGGSLGVVKPQGLSFHDPLSDSKLSDLSDLQSFEGRISMKVDGHTAREVPGPTGLPFFGTWFQVYPDHLGNHQRLYDQYGPIFKTNNMGGVTYNTNDPELGWIVQTEGPFFSKEIVPGHPIYPIKMNLAGVFLGDTSSPHWKVVHKFLPPALGPKAVRHYAPIMNGCVHDAFRVFDELEQSGKAWNAYQYMYKLGSQTVGKIMLGHDFKHFESVDSPVAPLPMTISEQLALNRKVTTRGPWYQHLPIGDPARLKTVAAFTNKTVQEFVDAANVPRDAPPLPLQDAALQASNIVEYLVRAEDSQGNRMPEENLMPAVLTATGAGFNTSAALLGWLVNSITLPNMQARLLQELVDNDINDVDNIPAEKIDDLHFLDNFVKETQRRHSTGSQPSRTAMQDCILPGGYIVKKGTVVSVSTQHLHMNPNVWRDPMRFDPDRWDTEEIINRPKNIFTPFASGQRACIGFAFATLEVKIFVCKLVYRYHFEKEGECEVEYDQFFNLIRPVNLFVRTQKRTEWPSKSSERQ